MICIIGDPHFGAMKSDEGFLKNQINYFDNELVPYLKTNKITKLNFLGDLFEDRNKISVRVKNEVFHLFERLKDFDIKILLGNHDIFYNTTRDVHSLKFLKKFSNVEVIDSIKTIDSGLYIPWLVDNDELVNYIKENEIPQYAYGHLDIYGFKMTQFETSQSGLPENIFSKFKYVFSGHFHIRSIKNNIIYTGAPYHLNRNDIGIEKGVCLLDESKGTYEFLNSTSTIRFEKIKYPEIPVESIVKDNIIDLEIEYNKDYDEAKVYKYIKDLEKLAPRGNINVKMINNFLNPEDAEQLKNVQFISNKQLIDEYIKNIDITDKETVHSKINELYERCTK